MSNRATLDSGLYGTFRHESLFSPVEEKSCLKRWIQHLRCSCCCILKSRGNPPDETIKIQAIAARTIPKGPRIDGDDADTENSDEEPPATGLRRVSSFDNLQRLGRKAEPTSATHEAEDELQYNPFLEEGPDRTNPPSSGAELELPEDPATDEDMTPDQRALFARIREYENEPTDSPPQ